MIFIYCSIVYIIKMKLICAPMATLSHSAFRMLIENFGGCDEFYTEMINAPSLVANGHFEKYYLDASPSKEKIVWQLTGKDVSSMCKAAKILVTKGGLGIDLNMGCCAPEIVKSGAGIAWMLKPVSETLELVRSVKDVLNSFEAENSYHFRFSVKCRLGDENFSEQTFFDFTDMLVKNGVERICLHPRTKKEKYREKPRWFYAQKLAERYDNLPVEVVVNGDVCDAASASKVLAACPGCDGLMIGRAAVTKPWIFMILRYFLDGKKLDSKVDLLDCSLKFIDWVEQKQPKEFYKTRLLRFFTYFCENLSFAHYARTQMLNAENLDDSRARICEYFKKVPEDRFLTISV